MRNPKKGRQRCARINPAQHCEAPPDTHDAVRGWREKRAKGHRTKERGDNRRASGHHPHGRTESARSEGPHGAERRNEARGKRSNRRQRMAAGSAATRRHALARAGTRAGSRGEAQARAERAQERQGGACWGCSGGATATRPQTQHAPPCDRSPKGA